MKKNIINLLILFLVCIVSWTCGKDEIEPIGSVEGVISSNGLAVNGASITLGTTGQTTSDFQGRYSFIDIDSKTYQIKIAKGGYVPINENLTIIGGKSQVKDFEFVKISGPIIYTNEASNITPNTASFSANVSFLGNGFPGTVEHGHCWSLTPEPILGDFKTELGTINSTGEYQSEIVSLEAKTTYYVRSYIKIGPVIFYGNQIEFRTKAFPPEINGFTPKFGPIGTRVEINGNHFSTTILENIVKFGSFTAEIESATEHLLVVKVPYVNKAQKVNISVTIEDMTDVSQELFDIWFPWSQKNSQGSKTFYAASFVVNNFGYVIGSNSTNMLKYNQENDSWENNLSLPENSGKKPFAFKSGTRIFALLDHGFWEYNAVTNKWTQRANFPGNLQTDRRYNFNFSIDMSLYIGNCYKTYDMWEYNVLKDSWGRKADFIGNFDTLNPVWGNYTFSVGQKGFLGVSQTAFAINTLWEYNPSQDVWVVRTPIPSDAHSLYASFLINNEAYVGLGSNFEWGDGYVSNELWKYDAINDTWIKFPNSPINMAVYASFGINNKGYILPLYTKFDDRIDDVWEFDPSRN